MREHLKLSDLIEATGLSPAHLRRLARKPAGDPQRIPGAFSPPGRKQIRYMNGRPLRRWIAEAQAWSLARTIRRSGRPAAVIQLRAWDRVVLDEKLNALAFPDGMRGLTFAQGTFVEYRKPVPADLLKSNMTKGHGVEWAEICNGSRKTLTVYAGFDQAGRVVELVKVAEAVLAADLNGATIFNWATLQRYKAEHGIKVEAQRRALSPKTSRPPARSRS